MVTGCGQWVVNLLGYLVMQYLTLVSVLFGSVVQLFPVRFLKLFFLSVLYSQECETKLVSILRPQGVWQQIYVLFPGDYLSVISCFYQVLVDQPLTSAMCLDQPLRCIIIS